MEKKRVAMDRIKLKISDISVNGDKMHRITAEEKFYLQTCLKKYGQIRPVIVQQIEQKYQAVDGRVLLTEMKYLGMEEVDCLILPQHEDPFIFWSFTNLPSIEIAEENVAEKVWNLVKERGIKFAQNNLPLENDAVEHYYELFEFIWKEYLNNNKTNQISLF